MYLSTGSMNKALSQFTEDHSYEKNYNTVINLFHSTDLKLLSIQTSDHCCIAQLLRKQPNKKEVV